MKTKRNRTAKVTRHSSLFTLLTCFLLHSAGNLAVVAQNTVVTYQGRVTSRANLNCPLPEKFVPLEVTRPW